MENRVLDVVEKTRNEAEARYSEGAPWGWTGQPAAVRAETNGQIEDLLSTNPKVEKGEALGYATFILHLSPSDLSGYQVCPLATEGCRGACLNASGQGAIMAEGQTNNVQVKRVLRTLWFFRDRPAFMHRLVREVELAIRRAKSKGLVPVFRLNGTSDIRWETVPVERDGESFDSIFDAFPGITFYDYTKLPNRRIDGVDNYSLTFSLADGNEQYARQAVENGQNLAVVFRSVDLIPETFTLGDVELPVIDGDASDLRFLDPKPCVVGLYAKGVGSQDTTGFVKDSDYVALPVLQPA